MPVDSVPELLAHAPDELTRGRLRRLGEGVGKVVYASEHWVVKRDRSPSEIVALILVWKVLRKLERLLPDSIGRRLVQRPARQIRFLRSIAHALMRFLPQAIWLTSHVREVWKVYHSRSTEGERLAAAHLAGTDLVPRRITFPPTTVTVGGWPGELTVCEAIERVETTLDRRILDLSRAGRFDEIELWLNRFLDLRQRGWRRGLFSVDAHLKNFGVLDDRIVLLDTGGLTNRIADVERRIAAHDSTRPHIELGLGPALATRPDIADRFNARWKDTVSTATVQQLWNRAS